MNGRIDIEKLGYDELLELNRIIVARLKFLDASRKFMEMLDFRVGNTVEFWSSDGRLIRGTVAKPCDNAVRKRLKKRGLEVAAAGAASPD
ncbi:MAG: hypothetical protein ACP5I4_10435 [Oceanipulchritudo sp.]